MDVLIRRAAPADAAAVAALLNPIIAAGSYTAIATSMTEEGARTWIDGFGPRGFGHVAVRSDDGAVVGFQNLEPLAPRSRAFDHVATIGTYVALGCHRRGIAARLFDATYAAALELGYEKVFTFIRADNAAGLRAYAGQGFVEVGRAPAQAKIRGRYIDEVMVEKWLVPRVDAT